jgi:hypothetical protein
MKQSDRIRAMIEHNAGALEEVARAHSAVKDNVADVDRTIKTILEVSRDLRQMTGSLGTAFSWFDEALRITDAARGEEGRDTATQREAAALEGTDFALRRTEMLQPESSAQRPQLLETLSNAQAAAAAPAVEAEPAAEDLGELEPVELEVMEPEPAEAQSPQPLASLPAGPGAPRVGVSEDLEELEALEE